MHISQIRDIDAAGVPDNVAADFGQVCTLVMTDGANMFKWGDGHTTHECTSWWDILTKHMSHLEWIERGAENQGAKTKPEVWPAFTTFRSAVLDSAAFAAAPGEDVKEKLQTLAAQIVKFTEAHVTAAMKMRGYDEESAPADAEESDGADDHVEARSDAGELAAIWAEGSRDAPTGPSVPSTGGESAPVDVKAVARSPSGQFVRAAVV